MPSPNRKWHRHLCGMSYSMWSTLPAVFKRREKLFEESVWDSPAGLCLEPNLLPVPTPELAAGCEESIRGAVWLRRNSSWQCGLGQPGCWAGLHPGWTGHRAGEEVRSCFGSCRREQHRSSAFQCLWWAKCCTDSAQNSSKVPFLGNSIVLLSLFVKRVIIAATKNCSVLVLEAVF